MLLVLGTTSCHKDDKEIELSKCITKKINKMKKRKDHVHSAVWRWQADGKIYYYLSGEDGGYDRFNLLYDDNCNVVCAPDGGLSGRGDGNCPCFVNGVQKELIWERK